MTYLRWFRAAIAERSRLTFAVGACVLLASMLVGSVFFFEGDIVASGNGRFGTADGRYGPVVPAAAREMLDLAAVDQVAASVTCDGTVVLGKSSQIVDARWIATNAAITDAAITDTMLTNNAAATIRTRGGVAMSAPLAASVGVGAGDVVAIGGQGVPVTTLGSDVDAVDARVVFIAGLATTPDDAGCYVLGPSHEWALQADTAASVSDYPGFWWPRSNESAVIAYRVLIGFAIFVIGIAVLALLTAGLGLLVSSLSSDLQLVHLIGAPERQVRRTVTLGLAGIASAAVVAGILVAAIAEAVLGQAVADGFGVARLGGLGGPVRPLLAAGTLLGASVMAVRSALHHSRRPDNPTTSRRGLTGLAFVAGGAAAMALANSRFSTWFGLGAGALIIGALLAVPVLAQLVLGVLSRRRTQTRVAAAQVNLQRGSLLPMILIVAMLGGLTLMADIGLSSEIESKTKSPTTHAGQFIVTTQIDWNLPGEGDAPSGALTADQRDALEKAVGTFGTIAELRTVTVAVPGMSEPVPLDFIYESTQIGGELEDATFVTESVPVYVATPQILTALGVEPRGGTEAIELYTGLFGNAQTFNAPQPGVQVIKMPGLDTTVAPAALVMPDDADRLGESVPVGALVTVAQAADHDRVQRALQDLSQASGITVFGPPDTSALTRVLWITRIVGALLIAAAALLAGFILARLAKADRLLLYLIGASDRTQHQIERISATVIGGCALPTVAVIALASSLLFESSNPAGRLGAGALSVFVLAVIGGIAGARLGAEQHTMRPNSRRVSS